MTTIICPFCKKATSLDNDFCYHCGHSFKVLTDNDQSKNPLEQASSNKNKKNINFIYYLPILFIGIWALWKIYFKDIFKENMKRKALTAVSENYIQELKINDKLWTEQRIHWLKLNSPIRINEVNNIKNNYYDTQKTYYGKSDWAIIFCFYAKDDLSNYDIEEGLEGGVQNAIANLNGVNLKMESRAASSESDAIYISGYFNIDDNAMRINGFGDIKNQEEFIMIISISPGKYSELM